MSRADLPARARELGLRVASRWGAAGRRPAAFPEVARRALEQARLHEADAASVLPWTLRSPHLPRQFGLHNDFGDPPLTLYWDDAFVVDLLYWTSPATSVHDHSFRGAFCVIEGASLECSYRFDRDRRERGPLLFGGLSLLSCELLRPGAVRPIVQGPSMIHAVWHLSRPTLSIVVRLIHETSHPQFEYLAPGLAVENQKVRLDAMLDPLTVKRRGLLDYLCRAEPDQAVAFARRLAGGPGLVEAYLYLRRFCELDSDPARRDEVFSALRRRHGASRARALRLGIELAEPLRSFRWQGFDDDGPRLLFALLFSGAPAPARRRLLAELRPRGGPPDVLAGRWLSLARRRGLLTYAAAEGFRRTLRA